MRCRWFQTQACALIATVALIVPAAVHPEAQLPLPELVKEPVVSEKVHEQIKRESAELEQRVKALESELANQREAAAASKDKQRATEAQARKAQDELAKFKSGQKKKAESQKKSDRAEETSKGTRHSFEPEMVLIEGGDLRYGLCQREGLC